MKFPPPLLFVGGFGLGLGLNRQLEFLIDGRGAGPFQTSVGLAAMVTGFFLMIWGLLTFLHARTAVMPSRPARQFVRHGPYRVSRNPMYLGLTLAYLGGSAVTNLAWPLLMLPAVIAALTRFVIRREEAYLLAEFGDEYAAYLRATRRWI